MADDEFDIDIYGDVTPDETPLKKDDEGDVTIEGLDSATAEISNTEIGDQVEAEDDEYIDIKVEADHGQANGQQQIKSTDDSGNNGLSIPKQAPQQQGVKRKGSSDEREIDPGATTALMISELHWWNTDDDVRGWINQAQVEDELKDITFSEHKVNGKSKGQAYVEFTSQGAATAAKRKIDEFGSGQQYAKKVTITYSNPNINPFRTLPKDAPVKNGRDGPSNRGGAGWVDRGGNQNGGSFRGRTPGYNSNRGAMNNGNMNGNNYNNRSFSGSAMGNMNGGFNAPMGGFQNTPMGGQFQGGFNRGGMMGGMRGNMRGGGRGGMMNGGMMGGMPMGAMPMGMPAMGGMPMNMGQMGGGMQGTTHSSIRVQIQKTTSRMWQSGSTNSLLTPRTLIPPGPTTYNVAQGAAAQVPHYNHVLPPQVPPSYITQAKSHPPPPGGGFQNMQPHFNPAFFQPNTAAGGDWQNPHGAKRPRPE